MSSYIKQENFDDDVNMDGTNGNNNNAYANIHNKLECRFKDQAMLKTLLECAHGIDTECITLTCEPEELSYKAVDENQVSMMQWKLNTDAFDFYQASTTNTEEESFDISLNLSLLMKVLKICKARDQVCFLYDTQADRGHIDVSFLDPNADRTRRNEDEGPEIKQEPGSAAVKKPNAKSRAKKPITAMNQFKMTTREGSDLVLPMPDIHESSTKIEMSPVLFKHASDSILEMAMPDQKNATVHITCPIERYLDAEKKCYIEGQDVVKFGTSNTTGDMGVSFLIPRSAEQMLTFGGGNTNGNTTTRNDSLVRLSRGENFGEKNRVRFANKFIGKMASAVPIAERYIMYCANGYPMITVIPLSNGYGEMTYVVSARLEDGNDDDNDNNDDDDINQDGNNGENQNGETNGETNGNIDDIFGDNMDEDEFSD